MQYRLKKDTVIRIVDNFVYLKNQRHQTVLIIDKSGVEFIRPLSYEAKHLHVIEDEISRCFHNIDPEILQKDIFDFYAELENGGYIISGLSETEVSQKEKFFSYTNIKYHSDNQEDNVFIEPTEFILQHAKIKPWLSNFQIELTSRCNERCVHCYIPHENKINDIDISFFKDTLAQCMEMGVINLTLSGGEPMIHPHFIKLLEATYAYDFSVNILSNLTMLNEEIIDRIKAHHRTHIQVSLYSTNPDTHDSITKLKGSFYKTKDSIFKLIENDIPLQISCPALKQNKKDIINVINWAHGNKLGTVGCDTLLCAKYDGTKDNLDNRIGLSDVGQIIQGILKIDKDYQHIALSLEKQNTKNDQDKFLCSAGVSMLCMDSYGNIFPCSVWQNYKMGNLMESSLKDIFLNSEQAINIRNVRLKDYHTCVECDDLKFCNLCPARNSSEDPEGNALKINPHFCEVAKLNHRLVLEWKENSYSGAN